MEKKKYSLNAYIKDIHDIQSRGDAREESFYFALKELIEQTAEELNKDNVYVTVMPKKTEAGNPDFRIWDGKAKIIGYIEAKKPEIDLDEVVDREQIKRYLKTFPNFILTNFLEFRFYRNGNEVDTVFIARRHTLVKVGAKPVVEHEQAFGWLFEKFFSFTFPKNLNAQQLANELAKRTRFLRDQVIVEELRKEEGEQNYLRGFFEAFHKYLIHGLTEPEFADLYAQTVTYGLFAARTRCSGDFTRITAYNYIPRSIGILHDVFAFISFGKTSPQMEWIVDDIAEVLASIDVEQILAGYYSKGKGEDPILFFYESFLAEYDPKLREKRGVYYTPLPVVRFIVRSLNWIIKETFGLKEGFGSPNVKVLDPAAGTMTFIAEAVKLALAELIEKYGAGMKENFLSDRLLKNFYAFELMMAPYTIGHMKMAYILEEQGYKLRDNERFQLYLTNALEMQEIEQSPLPGISTLSDESKEAGRIKKEEPILVILGNPPYSGHSANASVREEIYYTTGKQKKIRKIKTWIGELIDNYKKVDGKPLREKNSKWLQDDYVKFIRFAQWKIEQNGEGLVGLITNHSYLDNPTFRGMRRSLMTTFNEIHILDLHGNAKKKEKCPDGSKDENVFDIQQGVAVVLLVKKKGEAGCRIFHSELWGLREEKYNRLESRELAFMEEKALDPKKEFYLFIPRDETQSNRYSKFISITEIFPLNSVGIVTARDQLTIHWTPEEAQRTVERFARMDEEEARLVFNLGKDSKDWKIKLAQQDLLNSNLNNKNVTPILYRPFDARYTYYTGESSGFHCRPRGKVMRHMLHENISLCFMRQVSLEEKYTHALVSSSMVDNRTFLSSKGIILQAPLNLFQDPKKKVLFDEPQINIDQKVVEKLKLSLKTKGLKEIDIFYYVYAILYSNIFREKYSESLRMDFPRVPITSDAGVFFKMVELGKKLAELHLLKSKSLDKTFSRFEGEGNCVVRKIDYGKKCVYINERQYFSDISPEIWEYQIGGYPVLAKWLKERKGRALSLDDIRHFIRVACALQNTIEIQEKIDRIYPEVEKKLIKF